MRVLYVFNIYNHLMKVLSIVFSFRNEEKNIPELIQRIAKVLINLKDWKYELIFVNDDSSDSFKCKANLAKIIHKK